MFEVKKLKKFEFKKFGKQFQKSMISKVSKIETL